MRYRLRTLLIVLALAPPLLAFVIASALVAIQVNRTSVPPNVVIIDQSTSQVYVGPPP